MFDNTIISETPITFFVLPTSWWIISLFFYQQLRQKMIRILKKKRIYAINQYFEIKNIEFCMKQNPNKRMRMKPVFVSIIIACFHDWFPLHLIYNCIHIWRTHQTLICSQQWWKLKRDFYNAKLLEFKCLTTL